MLALLIETPSRYLQSLVEGSISLQSTADSLPRKVDALADRDLIEVTLRGDQRGYEQLTRRYQDRLFTSVLHDTGCPVLAEDIVQDAFVRAYLHLKSFRKECNFYTWLYRIALNVRSNYFRRRHRTLPLESLGGESDQISAAERDCPSRSLERDEEKHLVREALQRLQSHHRTVLVLREFDGFDYQTIADLLDVKVGTVRSRLSRAREQMKRELATYVAEPNDESDSRHDESTSTNCHQESENEVGFRIRGFMNANG